MTIFQRGNMWHLRRRVPRRYRSVEERKIVGTSLHTDSRTEARLKAEAVWANLVEGWEADLRGDGAAARQRYESAKEIAARRGFTLLSAPAVAALPLPDLLARVNAVTVRSDRGPDQRSGDALLGGVEKPSITVSEALNEFWKITVDQTRGKTEDQKRRWENPRKKAIANFIAVGGDKALAGITREDARKFRDWWNARIDSEGLSANSANKDLVHVAHTLRTVNDSMGLDLVLPLSGLNIKEMPKVERLPFSDKWIKDHLLKDGALDGLNVQARTILLAMVNTGARPSEVAGLMWSHVHLDADVPYIDVKPEGRELKEDAVPERGVGSGRGGHRRCSGRVWLLTPTWTGDSTDDHRHDEPARPRREDP